MKSIKQLTMNLKRIVNNVNKICVIIINIFLPVNIIGKENGKYFPFRGKIREERLLLMPRIVDNFKMFHLLDYTDNDIKNLIYKAKMSGEFYFFTSVSKDLSINLKRIVNNLGFSKKEVLLVNSPADPHRDMIRGYDGADIMIKNLESLDWRICDCLCKNKTTINQSRISKEKRLLNNLNNYSVANKSELNSSIDSISCIVLIDDVITTGTTASYCLQTLHLELSRYNKNINYLALSLAGLSVDR